MLAWRLFFRVFNQVDDLFQFAGADLFFVSEKGNQVLIRVFEIIAYKTIHKALFVLFLFYGRDVPGGIIYLLAFKKCFTLQVFDGRSQGGIGWFWFCYLVQKIFDRS